MTRLARAESFSCLRLGASAPKNRLEKHMSRMNGVHFPETFAFDAIPDITQALVRNVE